MSSSGPTNKKLRVHLPILAPSGGLSRLRVGSETRETVAGRALVFDDSFEHEAWNDDDNQGHRGSENEDAGTPSPSKVISGGGETDSTHEGEPGVEGKGRGSGQDDKGQAREAGARSGTGRPAPRVTLIADIWHPDLSDR